MKPDLRVSQVSTVKTVKMARTVKMANLVVLVELDHPVPVVLSVHQALCLEVA